MLKQYFVKQAIKEIEIEQFIKESFPMGDYSKIEIQRTPLGIKIVIYTNKPGRIIGRSGRNINEMTDAIKERFGLENPQLDVKTIRNPDLDAKLVAKQIVSSLERGFNYKKIGNIMIRRVMDAGAVGAQIVISGKFGTGKGATAKFLEGYLKHCGQPAKELVDYGFEEANTRPGKIGVKVKIMRHFMDIDGTIRTTRPGKDEVEQQGQAIVEEIQKEAAPAEEKAPIKEKPVEKKKEERRDSGVNPKASGSNPPSGQQKKEAKPKTTKEKAEKKVPEEKEGRRDSGVNPKASGSNPPSGQEGEKVKNPE
jgi:small subunit ribosomal protein S3